MGYYKLPTYTPPTPMFIPPRAPVRCPVCDGRGTVAHDFYPDDHYTRPGQRCKCRACSGRGIV